LGFKRAHRGLRGSSGIPRADLVDARNARAAALEKPNSACPEGRDAECPAANSSLENVDMLKSVLALTATCLMLAGCGNTLEQRIGGAAVGAGTGAVAAGPVGAVVGGAAGAISGPAVTRTVRRASR
jgi:osmotically inducible lipoprotein OsmB